MKIRPTGNFIVLIHQDHYDNGSTCTPLVDLLLQVHLPVHPMQAQGGSKVDHTTGAPDLLENTCITLVFAGYAKYYLERCKYT